MQEHMYLEILNTYLNYIKIISKQLLQKLITINSIITRIPIYNMARDMNPKIN